MDKQNPDHPRFTRQHSYYRDLVTKLLGTHEAEVTAIQDKSITTFEKIQLLEALQPVSQFTETVPAHAGS